ncbi:MFS transporter [Clostridium senegalense]|uniref:MFS transporter n=1 Tax=Clostridium senegalense TaxID=1465809 RepID=UPI00028973CD|nr:MFS transporter [Clostridium senegalense]
MNEEILKRYKHNSRMFFISYLFMGILSGIVNDTLITFLKQAQPTIVNSYTIYTGIATLLTAGLVAAIVKMGYKKILVAGGVVSIAGLILISFTRSWFSVSCITLVLILGLYLFDAVLPPFLTQYTTEDERDKVFSRTMYSNVAGMALASFTGGALIVWRFASRLGIAYDQAQALSTKTAEFTTAQNAAYISAHTDVFLIFVVIAVLATIPLLLLKEVKEDYAGHQDEKGKTKIDWRVLCNKYALLYLVYNGLIRFGASLIVPYFTIFLGTLGIDRATVSFLISLQTIAMVIFMMFSPWFSKKFGRVGAISLLSAISVPFMLIIGNGDKFGGMMVLAVGAGLFFRAGFMNAANPIVQSLPMEFVTKELRPAYSSVIFVSQAIVTILAGLFTAGFLFNENFLGDSGYRIAYYVTAVIYSIAIVILLTQFTKKFNRPQSENEEEEVAS